MNDSHDTLDELISDYLEKAQSGTAPSPEAYAAAHPAFAAELRASLPLVLEMECVGASHDAPDASEVPVPDFSGTDFRIVRKIGSGGMGVVYEALQVSLNRKVALKMLSPARLVEDDSIRRLENEARIIAQLYHPNIIKVHAAGHVGGTFFYAMELLSGTDLASNPPATPQETARIGLEAARALAYAHGCGVLHCDIKPSNLFRDADGVLKIGDFGLAFSLEDLASSSTSPRDGTRRYMAPERLARKKMDFASDQYALGATLYEFLAKRPLDQDSSEHRPAFPRGVDSDLRAIIAKSLAEDPAKRYPSMADMADDLANYLDHRPVAAARPSPLRRVLLWARRDAFRAAACLFAAVCAAGFVIALVVGFVRTHHAMVRARTNAQVANDALGVVFRHVADQPPSPHDAQLLKELLPYYESLVDDAQMPDTDRSAVYDILSKCALRCGKYELAERILRQAVACGGYDADEQSRLAIAIQRQGRKQEADAIWNEIAAKLESGDTPDERAVAARALINASDNPASPNCKRAFDIIARILRTSPDNAKARLEYARLLMNDCPYAQTETIPGVPADPVALLATLAEQDPHRAYFAILHVQSICQRLQRKLHDNAPIDDDDAAHVLEWTERLYARFANHPGAASLAFRARRLYLLYITQNAPPPRRSREQGRFDEFCLSIFNSPEVPEQDKEAILETQLDSLSENTDSSRRFRLHARIVERELQKFVGRRKAEFEARYKALQEQVAETDLQMD